MALYEGRARYRWIGHAASTANVALQSAFAILALRAPMDWAWHVAVFGAAYLLADFINGLVHLYMDGNDDYTSPAGPLVAAFHLHHRTPLYKKNPLIVVYFHETGSKLWLVPVLLAGILWAALAQPHPAVVWLLTWFGILSSVAEVSHYRCHVPDSRTAKLFGNYGLLLSKRHHARHHREDNVSYAFLSGITDPLIDMIARRCSRGYKETTDRHYAGYQGGDTANRG